MLKSSKAVVWAVIICLPGCDINYATFVTSTHVGIKADTKTEQVSIGTSRSNGFLGPGYPQQGSAPSAFGYLQSNAEVFTPQVTQLYATGDAADAVTQPAGGPAPAAAPAPPSLSGTRRPLVFATNTDVRLKLGFIANAPSSINFGYDREEVSIIPLQPKLDSGSQDKYAPVLASVTLNATTSSASSSGLAMNDLFATGAAAVNLAHDPVIQNLFKQTAQGQVTQATVQSAIGAVASQVATVKKYLDSGAGYASNCPTLAGEPAFQIGAWDVQPCTLSEDAFIAKLNTRPDLAQAAASAVPAS